MLNLDPKSFRNVLARYPTGVSIITAHAQDGAPIGMLVGSFASVSLDPPLVAFMPDKNSSSWAKLAASKHFCANILGAGQEELCRVFSAKTDPATKFRSVSHTLSPLGCPIIDGVVAWIDCERQQMHDAGDHIIVLGHVRGMQLCSENKPLVFCQGALGHFSPMQPTSHEASR